MIVDKLKNTHKNWWECDTGIAYLVSGEPDWRTRRMTQVFDLSDPARPVLIRDFGLVGPATRSERYRADRAARADLHRAEGNRLYFGYGTNKAGVLQIIDRAKLLAGPQRADAGEPARARRSAASIFPRSAARTPPCRSSATTSQSSPGTRAPTGAISSRW